MNALIINLIVMSLLLLVVGYILLKSPVVKKKINDFFPSVKIKKEAKVIKIGETTGWIMKLGVPLAFFLLPLVLRYIFSPEMFAPVFAKAGFKILGLYYITGIILAFLGTKQEWRNNSGRKLFIFIYSLLLLLMIINCFFFFSHALLITFHPRHQCLINEDYF